MTSPLWEAGVILPFGAFTKKNKKWKTAELFPNKKFGYYKENETTTRKIIFKANNVALFI